MIAEESDSQTREADGWAPGLSVGYCFMGQSVSEDGKVPQMDGVTSAQRYEHT